jgi:hypothetical protein
MYKEVNMNESLAGFDLVETSSIYPHKWETKKHYYEGTAVDRLWKQGEVSKVETIRLTCTRQKVESFSKYMPHQSKREIERREMVNEKSI